MYLTLCRPLQQTQDKLKYVTTMVFLREEDWDGIFFNADLLQDRDTESLVN